MALLALIIRYTTKLFFGEQPFSNANKSRDYAANHWKIQVDDMLVAVLRDYYQLS